MQNTVKERLIIFIKYLGLSKNAFERRCGLSTRAVSNIVSTINDDTLKKIVSTFPELNPAWLMINEGEMLKTQSSVTQHNVNGNNNYVVGHHNSVGGRPLPAVIEVKDNCVEVECPKCGETIEIANSDGLPVVPAKVMTAPDFNVTNWIKTNSEKLSTIRLSDLWGADTVAVEVDTRVMEPRYREGSYLVIRKLPDISYARADGTPYVVDAMRPHALLRNLSKERDGGYILTAEDERKTPLYLRADEIYGVWDIVGGFWLGRN